MRTVNGDVPLPPTPWEIITSYLDSGPLRGTHGADASVTAAEIINRLYRSGYSIVKNDAVLA